MKGQDSDGEVLGACEHELQDYDEQVHAEQLHGEENGVLEHKMSDYEDEQQDVWLE